MRSKRDENLQISLLEHSSLNWGCIFVFRQKAEEDALSNQIGSQNELLHTFEKSIHQKDVVITNLTNALEIQVRTFY